MRSTPRILLVTGLTAATLAFGAGAAEAGKPGDGCSNKEIRNASEHGGADLTDAQRGYTLAEGGGGTLTISLVLGEDDLSTPEEFETYPSCERLDYRVAVHAPAADGSTVLGTPLAAASQPGDGTNPLAFPDFAIDASHTDTCVLVVVEIVDPKRGTVIDRAPDLVGVGNQVCADEPPSLSWR